MYIISSSNSSCFPPCLSAQICQEAQEKVNSSHLTCNITGRPCCVGIQAHCLITTLEDCDFRQGRFHPDAFLCSQVNDNEGYAKGCSIDSLLFIVPVCSTVVNKGDLFVFLCFLKFPSSCRLTAWMQYVVCCLLPIRMYLIKDIGYGLLCLYMLGQFHNCIPAT